MTPTTAVTTAPRSAELVYPTTDGRPMGETDLHRNIMFASIESLKLHYAGQQVYVSGNILLFYQPGNRRRHVSPDVQGLRSSQPSLSAMTAAEHTPSRHTADWQGARISIVHAESAVHG